MEYSQKYSLVAFLEPITVSTEFKITDWPVHITIADVFSVDLTANLENQLIGLAQKQLWLTLATSKEGNLGETRVIFVNNTDDFQNFHNKIIDVLEQSGAKFNNAEFTREGFLPHLTVNESSQLSRLGKVEVRSVSLVDMFPEGNWRQRKVLRNFELKSR